LAFFSSGRTRFSRLSRSASISSVSTISASLPRAIDLALDMGDVAVLEAAQHMGDGVAFADIGEELVAQAFALGGAAHEARRCRRRSCRVGMISFDLPIAASFSSRASGTGTSPTFGSMVQKG
jgi:hypothetical protein